MHWEKQTLTGMIHPLNHADLEEKKNFIYCKNDVNQGDEPIHLFKSSMAEH